MAFINRLNSLEYEEKTYGIFHARLYILYLTFVVVFYKDIKMCLYLTDSV